MSPLRRMLHWGPIASLAITASISFATISTETNIFLVFVFHLTMCLCLYNMWCATFIGPGYISVTVPQESPESGRFCKRCCQIVLQKHHHCPWIKNCVGQYNEQYFLRFLVFAIAASAQAILHIGLEVYQKTAYTLFNLLNLGLSLGVLVAISVLLYIH